MEFGTGYVGPVVGLILAQAGAEVIKIESHRNPDFMRKSLEGPRVAASFLDVNRGKKSVLIDAKQPQGHDLLLRLAEKADVVVENFGAGVMGRLGLDYESIKTVKPDVIMISLQGLGATAFHSVTLGQNIPPLIGLTYLWNHGAASKPVGSQLFHPDYFAGVYAACLVVSALDDRKRTGRGHYIDAAQAEIAASLLGPYYLAWSVSGEAMKPHGNRGFGGAPTGCYRCQGEDDWCIIVVDTDLDWERFKEAMDHPAWAADEKFKTILGRLRNRAELDRFVESWTMRRPAREVMEKLQKGGVACGVAQNAGDLVQDEQLIRQEFIAHVNQPGMGQVSAGGSPMKFSAIDVDAAQSAPLFGEHTEMVLDDVLGLSKSEIASLREQRVLW